VAGPCPLWSSGGKLPARLGNRLTAEMAFEEIQQIAVERLELLQRQTHGVAGDILGNVGAAFAGNALEHALGAGNESSCDLFGDVAAGLLVERQVGGAGAAADGAVAVVIGNEIKRFCWRRGEGRSTVASFAEGFARGGLHQGLHGKAGSV